MKKIFSIPLLFLFLSCKKEDSSYFTSGKALFYINRIEKLCNDDGGRLWGKNITGPMLFFDGSSRRVVSNVQDSEGLLRGKDGIYTGIYPGELTPVTGPVNLGSRKYALISLPPKEDSARIIRAAIRALFHLYQDSRGIRPVQFTERYFDDKEARLLIKLEWKALRKAILSEGNERTRFVRDALVFRGSHKEIFSRYSAAETKLENYEGLATYTYLRLSSHSAAGLRTSIIQNIDRAYAQNSFIRSYAYNNGAFYAALLTDKGYDFKTPGYDTLDLCEEVRKAYAIELPSICRDVAGSLALNYDIDLINKEEDKRLATLKEDLNKLASPFTGKPVVFIDLESPSFDFEAENIRWLDTLGIYYPLLRVSDNWGKLYVDDGGCLVSSNYKAIRINARNYKTEKNRISGLGWHIVLNDGWEFVQNNESYFLKKNKP